MKIEPIIAGVDNLKPTKTAQETPALTGYLYLQKENISPQCSVHQIKLL